MNIITKAPIFSCPHTQHAWAHSPSSYIHTHMYLPTFIHTCMHACVHTYYILYLHICVPLHRNLHACGMRNTHAQSLIVVLNPQMCLSHTYIHIHTYNKIIKSPPCLHSSLPCAWLISWMCLVHIYLKCHHVKLVTVPFMGFQSKYLPPIFHIYMIDIKVATCR